MSRSPPGASGAFILAFLAAFDAGARVAVGSPGYPAYRNILAALDIEVVPIVTDASTRLPADARSCSIAYPAGSTAC